MTAPNFVDKLGMLVHPRDGTAGEAAAVLDRAGDARFVPIGEAPHGMHEFYRLRAAGWDSADPPDTSPFAE